MPAYLSPGVFIEEVDSGARPIEAVGTSTAGFVGTAPIGDFGKGQAIAVDSYSAFDQLFVGAKQPKATDLASAVQGFFVNGGSRCYIANVGPEESITGGLEALNLIDEIAIIAAPGRTDPESYNALIDCAETMKDRVAILDPPPAVADVEQLTRVAGSDVKKNQNPGLAPRQSPKGYAAIYFPGLMVPDVIAAKAWTLQHPTDPVPKFPPIPAPPSGHIAGLWALTDSTRGVHKAPANMPLKGIVNLTRSVSRAEQDVLNPAGINVIRTFSREGTLVWGARTVAPSASNWKYLNVRRLFAMIEESIAIATRWVIFEPNDRPLWNDLKRDIGNFLRVLKGQGAIVDYFVKCDQETNPPELIDLGQVTVIVGIAPVKPAEFLVIRIGQTQAGTTVETL
jgi:phage tail sheath protein FI